MRPRTSILAAAAANVLPAVRGTPAEPVVMLRREARDSMSAVYRTYHRNWDQLADLTTPEKMLATVRPTQRECLGCLLGRAEMDAAAREPEGTIRHPVAIRTE